MKSRQRILDTNILIGYWRRCWSSRGNVTAEMTRKWAEDLAQLHRADGITTPIYVEFIAGVRSSPELDLARSFLSVFRIVDNGKIPFDDWELAKRLAARVPRDGKNRDLGDCLTRAIAIRLSYDVRTIDKRFPRG